MIDLAELNELRQYLRVPVPDEEPDPPDAETVVLGLALSAASSAVRRAASRPFEPIGDTPTPIARVYTARRIGDGRIAIPIDDTFSEGADVAIAYDRNGDGDFSTMYSGVFVMSPWNATSRGLPYTEILLARSGWVPLNRDAVRVTTVYGWAAVPTTIRNATLLQATRYVKRRDAPFGIAGSPEMGNEMRLLAKLDPDVEMMVGDFRRWWA